MEPFIATRSILRFGAFVAMLLLAPGLLFAAEHNIAFIKSNSTLVYQQLIEGIKNRLAEEKDLDLSFRELTLDEVKTSEQQLVTRGRFELLVAIGQAAAEVTLKLETKTPKIFTLVPKQSFNELLKNASPEKQIAGNIGAVYIDTPTKHQLLLAKILLGKNVKLSMITSRLSGEQATKAIHTAKDLELNLEVHEVDGKEHLIRDLVMALNGSNALLTLPDPSIINRNTARNILLTTYRHKVPVITFSAAYVRAGALAAVYSSAEQIAKQTAESIISALTRNSYTMENAKYFSVSINANVAKSLGIRSFDETAVLRQLQNEVGTTP